MYKEECASSSFHVFSTGQNSEKAGRKKRRFFYSEEPMISATTWTAYPLSIVSSPLSSFCPPPPFPSLILFSYQAEGVEGRGVSVFWSGTSPVPFFALFKQDPRAAYFPAFDLPGVRHIKTWLLKTYCVQALTGAVSIPFRPIPRGSWRP